jgi:hypothetical protein
MNASMATLLPPLIRSAAFIASSAFFTAAAFAAAPNSFSLWPCLKIAVA